MMNMIIRSGTGYDDRIRFGYQNITWSRNATVIIHYDNRISTREHIRIIVGITEETALNEYIILTIERLWRSTYRTGRTAIKVVRIRIQVGTVDDEDMSIIHSVAGNAYIVRRQCLGIVVIGTGNHVDGIRLLDVN